MKKKTKIFSPIISLILIAALACTPVFAETIKETSTEAEVETEITTEAKKKNSEKKKSEHKTEENSDLAQEIEEAESQKQELKNSKKNAEDYIKAVDGQLSTLTLEIYETQKKVEDTQQQIKKIKKVIKKAQRDINAQYADMKLRIQYMYENGDSRILDMLLNSESISEILNKAEYISEISQYDRDMLNKLKDTKKEIVSAKKTLEANKERLLAMQEQQDSDKTKLEKLSESKKKELKSYEKLLADSEASAKKLEKEVSKKQSEFEDSEKSSKKAEKESKKAAEQVRKATAERKKIENQKQQTQNAASKEQNEILKENRENSGAIESSGYIWPLPGYSKISSGFGYRTSPTKGTSEYHSGLDIPAPAGTPIIASASGKVAWSSYSESAGEWIGIYHGDNVYTVYMHMSVRLVSEGEEVSQGQIIGLVGTTGDSTGYHLHFSVKIGNTYVDPRIYVNANN